MVFGDGIELKGDLGEELNVALFVTAQNNGFETAKVLLNHGANPLDQSSGFGTSPLERARQSKNQKIVRLFEDYVASHPELAKATANPAPNPG